MCMCVCRNSYLALLGVGSIISSSTNGRGHVQSVLYTRILKAHCKKQSVEERESHRRGEVEDIGVRGAREILDRSE